MLPLIKLKYTSSLFDRDCLFGIFSMLFALITSLGSPVDAFAQNLYVVKDKNGVITFTSKKPKGKSNYRTMKARSPRFSRVHKRRGAKGGFRVRKSRYDALIKKTSLAHGVNPALVKAVIHIESAFRPGAKSNKGAVGLMQLMPATAKRFGVKDRYDPAENVSGGVKYLHWLLKHFKGNTRLALAAYNAGEGAVKRHKGIPPYRETKNYVKKVSKAFRLYHKQGL